MFIHWALFPDHQSGISEMQVRLGRRHALGSEALSGDSNSELLKPHLCDAKSRTQRRRWTGNAQQEAWARRET